DAPAAARATAIAQLAMTGVVVHAPGLDAATAALLGPDLAVHIGASLPGPACAEIEWELRSVAQRRAAMRGHGLPGPPPPVTAVLVSKRPTDVEGAVRALARQSYPNLEIVVGLHGFEM